MASGTGHAGMEMCISNLVEVRVHGRDINLYVRGFCALFGQRINDRRDYHAKPAEAPERDLAKQFQCVGCNGL